MDASQRREAIRLAAERGRTAAQKIVAQGPSCLYCKHGPANSPRGICSHPIFWPLEPNPTADGFNGRSMMGTIKARSPDGLCGPEAELFEPRNVVARLWRSVRPHLPLIGSDYRG